MSDIQRYSCERKINVSEKGDELLKSKSGHFVKHSDHIKAMSDLSYELNMSLSREQEQAKEIKNLKAHEKQLEAGFDKQAKEIERLTSELKECQSCIREWQP